MSDYDDTLFGNLPYAPYAPALLPTHPYDPALLPTHPANPALLPTHQSPLPAWLAPIIRNYIRIMPSYGEGQL